METIWDSIRFREAREKAKYTMAEAAEKLGIVYIFLQMLETGKRSPSQKLVSRMSDLYGVPVKDFLTDEVSVDG